ncbi:MAG TPA: HAD hydrolase family protein [Candidatus Eisenbacteria bacterium]
MPERGRREPQSGPAPTPVPVSRPAGSSSEPLAPTPLPELSELLKEPIQGPARILFLDLDGTLSDGVIAYDSVGDGRNFWVRDGLALQWARDLGVLSVVISGRTSKAAMLRMEDLGLEYYFGVEDKVAAAERVLEREKVRWEQCVMIGDDLPDVPLLKRVGWPIAVANAVREVRAIARTVTGARAGYGAVREAVEMVLRHNGTWEQVLKRYQVT